MQQLKEIGFLIKKEMILEWRQKYAIGGILLYVISTVFVVYLSFIQITDDRVWNTLFWILVLFVSVNAVTKSFVQENGSRQLYYYSLANPTAIILSKILYNTVLLLLLNGLTYAALSLFVGNPVQDMGLFLGILVLASFSFSISFTFISAISAKANNSSTLMAILAFPVVIPILVTLVKLSANALRLINDTAYWNDIYILLAIDSILLVLCFWLFPFLWRD